jgi:hypothetical protein
MNVENKGSTISHNTDIKHDAEAEFHMAFGWLAALSMTIASAALAAIS